MLSILLDGRKLQDCKIQQKGQMLLKIMLEFDKILIE